MTAMTVIPTSLIYAVVGAALFAIGTAGVLGSVHLLRRLLALNIAGSGVFLLLVGLAQRTGIVDPVAQALVLTGIVVAVSATALGVVLLRRLFAATGSATLDPPAATRRRSRR